MTDSVTASVRIAAPPEVVFPYFTDPALAVKWIADSASLDARPGGTFAIDVRGNPARGEFAVVDPPHRVVFTWGIEHRADFPPGSSTVEVLLRADRNSGEASRNQGEKEESLYKNAPEDLRD